MILRHIEWNINEIADKEEVEKEYDDAKKGGNAAQERYAKYLPYPISDSEDSEDLTEYNYGRTSP